MMQKIRSMFNCISNEHDNEKINIMDLPGEVLSKIVSYLDKESIIKFSSSSKDVRRNILNPVYENIQKDIVMQHYILNKICKRNIANIVTKVLEFKERNCIQTIKIVIDTLTIAIFDNEDEEDLDVTCYILILNSFGKYFQHKLIHLTTNEELLEERILKGLIAITNQDIYCQLLNENVAYEITDITSSFSRCEFQLFIASLDDEFLQMSNYERRICTYSEEPTKIMY